MSTIIIGAVLILPVYAYVFSQGTQLVTQTILKRQQPATITIASVSTATRIETQRAIWRNQRGLRYYYVIVQDGMNGLSLYKSAEGSTWSLVSTLSTDTTMSSSAYPYDDGTQLIVYVTYSDGGAWSRNRPVYYRRLLVQDGASDPIIGAEQNTGKGGVHAVIVRDRNGYVHIATSGGATLVTRGITAIFGTTTTNPGDAPSWSNSHTAISSIISTGIYISVQMVVFDSENLLGIIATKSSFSGTDVDGINVVSFNGLTYTIGIDTTIDIGSNSYHAFNAVVDGSGVVHLAVHNSRRGRVGLRYFKGSASNTVQSWNPAERVDSTAPESVAMSIDKTTTPNILYLFYAKGSTSLIYWRSRVVDALTWSAESNFDDGQGAALDWIQASNVLTGGNIPVMYTKQTSPYTVRFNGFIPP